MDTYGETNSFFKASSTVFLGGSLIKHGGQNPIEAARNGCKIIYGLGQQIELPLRVGNLSQKNTLP